MAFIFSEKIKLSITPGTKNKSDTFHIERFKNGSRFKFREIIFSEVDAWLAAKCRKLKKMTSQSDNCKNVRIFWVTGANFGCNHFSLTLFQSFVHLYRICCALIEIKLRWVFEFNCHWIDGQSFMWLFYSVSFIAVFVTTELALCIKYDWKGLY